jgi:hypothetical protein
MLELMYRANQWIRPKCYRHTATHRLNLSLLERKRQRSYQESKGLRRVAEPFRPQRVESAEPSSPPPTPPAPEPTGVPSELGAAPAHRNAKGISRAQDRERALRMELSNKVTALMKGNCGSIETREGLRFVSPGDPDYRAPMTSENALIAACMQLGIGDVEQGRALLKLWKFEEPTDS